MPFYLTCPWCRAKLTLSDAAPAVVTCPKCLNKLANPESGRVQPVRVVPIEEEVRHDFGLMQIIIVLMLVFGVVGFALSATQLGGVLMILAGIVLAIAVVGLVLLVKQTKPESNAPLPAPQTVQAKDAPTDGIRHLNYETPDHGPYKTRTPMGLQFFAGFMAWILCIILTIICINTNSISTQMQSLGVANNQFIFLIIMTLIVLLGVSAAYLYYRFRWRGFLPGMLLGLALTCLLPIGIVFVICGGAKF